ncbi:MAG: hypothetical protein GZ094_14610 [Mariniphaga sp.]|nr:hypothetical protein [Mariniphaga sp.]
MGFQIEPKGSKSFIYCLLVENKFLGLEEQGRTLLNTIDYHNKISTETNGSSQAGRKWKRL